MGAIGALSTAVGTLRRNPVIVLGVLAVSIVGSLTVVGQAFGGLASLAGSIVVFLLSPFFTAGALGMAEEGIEGRTSIATLLGEGAANYLTLLGATIIQFVLFAAVGIVWALVGFAALAGGIAASGAGGIGGALGVGLGLGTLAAIVLAGLTFLALLYFIQFYDVAVVIDDTGPWGAFKRSYVVVRRNLLSVLGYTLIAQAVNLIVLVPTVWVQFAGIGGFSPENAAAGGGTTGEALGSAAIADIAPGLAITLVLGTLVSSLLITYRVAYYGDATGGRTGDRNAVETRTAD